MNSKIDTKKDKKTENMQSGYIYIRNHPSYDAYDACKLGKANNIPERDTQYATGEIKRGYFELVIEMSKDVIGMVEKMLQNYFKSLGFHIYHDAGVEFYKRAIISLIVPYLEKTSLKFKVLTKQEIDVLVRCNRVVVLSSLLLQVPVKLHTNVQEKKCTPREDQKLLVETAVDYFQTKDKGLLILMCGMGKTLISLWITQKVLSSSTFHKNNNFILIGVPNKLLLEQWYITIQNLFSHQSVDVLLVSSGISEDTIQNFLEKQEKHRYSIVITTYASSHKVKSASQRCQTTYAMKILDEAHHLTTRNMLLANTTKSYVQILNVPAVKQIALTATLKQLASQDNDATNKHLVISNDDAAHFGEIIVQKNLLWAITNNIICDYVIQTIITSEDQLSACLDGFANDCDKRLFLSAYTALNSVNDGHSHHVLIYCNNKENALKIMQFVKFLLDHKYFQLLPLQQLFYSHYHSEMTNQIKSSIIENFEKSSYGIISCVYCLGEGWDFPLLDAVVFAENMTSNIRIVQSALRASRKYIHNPQKKSKIILPILYRDECEWLDDNPDLKKVREVVYLMGLEDDTIGQKIIVSHIDVKKQTVCSAQKSDEKQDQNFGDHDEELTQKLRLKTTFRSALGMTYEKTRRILVEKNIKSKDAYMELCKTDFRFSPDPEILFKSHFTDWIDFLSIQRGAEFFYDLETCKKKVIYYLSQPENAIIRNSYLDLAFACSELCNLDRMFPPNGLWVDYYKVKDLGDIIIISPSKKKKNLVSVL